MIRLLSQYIAELASDLHPLFLLAGLLAKLAPIAVLTYWTYLAFTVKKPKDVYEAAWLAIGWCALAFILKA